MFNMYATVLQILLVGFCVLLGVLAYYCRRARRNTVNFGDLSVDMRFEIFQMSLTGPLERFKQTCLLGLVKDVNFHLNYWQSEIQNVDEKVTAHHKRLASYDHCCDDMSFLIYLDKKGLNGAIEQADRYHRCKQEWEDVCDMLKIFITREEMLDIAKHIRTQDGYYKDGAFKLNIRFLF